MWSIREVSFGGSYLVKAAIGEVVDNETLGGATTHCEISGVTDYKCKDDKECLSTIRDMMGRIGDNDTAGFNREESKKPGENSSNLYGAFPVQRTDNYDVKTLLSYWLMNQNSPNINQIMVKIVCA